MRRGEESRMRGSGVLELMASQGKVAWMLDSSQDWGGRRGIGVKLRTHESAGDFTEDVAPGVRTPSRCSEKSPALARTPLKLTPMGRRGGVLASLFALAHCRCEL
jgi:hypothetical protein